MIDVEAEKLVTLKEACALTPGRPNLATMWRWRSRGLYGVRLEAIAIGGRTFTSKEALARFFERMTAAKNGEPIPSRTNRQRDEARRRAKCELQSAGIMD